MAANARQQHRSYLLRIWQAGNGNAPEWRLSLEDTRTHERQGFMDLAGLVAFLEALLDARDHSEPSNTQNNPERL